MKSGGIVLQGLADRLYKRYGMVVAILLAGPIAEDDGEIGLHRLVGSLSQSPITYPMPPKHPFGPDPWSPTQKMAPMEPQWIPRGIEVYGGVLEVLFQ